MKNEMGLENSKSLSPLSLKIWYILVLLIANAYAKLKHNFYDPFPLNGIAHNECLAKGTWGVCMFSWECQNMGGVALDVCRDGIFFGACCTSPPIINPMSSFLTILGDQLFPLEKGDTKIECGKSLPNLGEFDSRIVNGTDAKIGEFPWQASLRVVTPFPITLPWCGAVVISNQWVITAAHCSKGLKIGNIVVRFGSYSIYTNMDPLPLVERKAVRVLIHPKFTTLSKGHDVALIKVNEPVTFNEYIAPICLPGMYAGDLTGVKAIVSGWGKGHSDGEIPVYLQKAVVPILDNKECEEMYWTEGKKIHMNKHMMCAGYQEGGTDSCQGDSGGPLQALGDDGRWFLAGVTSSGFKCAKPNLPGLYTRVSFYVPWILKHIAN